MPRQIHIPDHLILPFGTARKFDLKRVRLSSVGANGIYFTSDISCIYIDRRKKKPLTMGDYEVLKLGKGYTEPDDENIKVSLNYISGLIRKSLPEPTSFQLTFLEYYMEWIAELAMN